MDKWRRHLSRATIAARPLFAARMSTGIRLALRPARERVIRYDAAVAI